MKSLLFVAIFLAVLFLIGLIILFGFRKIPIIHKAVLMRWGKRLNVTLDEGWHFFWFYPLYEEYKLVEVKEITFPVVIKAAFTPDGATSDISILLTIVPLDEHIIEYLNAGGEEGVKDQFIGKIQERIRQWAAADEEGPHTWRELNKSKIQGTSVLLKKLVPSSAISQVPDYAQDVPTSIWLRYFTRPRPIVPLYHEEQWMNNDWKKVSDVLDQIRSNYGESAIDDLKEIIQNRKDQIRDLSDGAGKFPIVNLGINLKRLNIGDINVLGEVAKKAEQEAKEEMERLAEELELQHLINSIQKLQTAGMSLEQALEAFQTERQKVSKTITETKLNVSPETRLMIESTFGTVAVQLIDLLSKMNKQ